MIVNPPRQPVCGEIWKLLSADIDKGQSYVKIRILEVCDKNSECYRFDLLENVNKSPLAVLPRINKCHWNEGGFNQISAELLEYSSAESTTQNQSFNRLLLLGI